MKSPSLVHSIVADTHKGIKLIDGNDFVNFSSDELEHAIINQCMGEVL